MKKVTIGGNRLGSGKKMKVTQRGFDRSTDNLSTIVRTSAAPGVLIPVYNNIVLPGDTWDIDIDSIVRTLPTVGPLFGSFKQQIDVFFCPIRLYQGIMHNNPVDIGMQMNKVILPKFAIYDSGENQEKYGKKYSSSSLLAYLGIRGFGTINGYAPKVIGRKIQAVDFLAYYDIFKNYYANKQEDQAKIIVGAYKNSFNFDITYGATISGISGNMDEVKSTKIDTWVPINIYMEVPSSGSGTVTDPLKPGYTQGTYLTFKPTEDIENIEEVYNKIVVFVAPNNNAGTTATAVSLKTITKKVTYGNTRSGKKTGFTVWLSNSTYKYLAGIDTATVNGLVGDITIEDFPLKNIDLMRERLLASNQPGSEFVIGTGSTSTSMYPYAVVAPPYSKNGPKVNVANYLPMNGLVVKTYQNDILNNWINKEWIDGNGVDGNGNPISYITRVDTSEGYFTMDTLNVAQKLYNSMIEVAVGNGTIAAWQSAIYNVDGYGQDEIPIYIGGMSGEVVFEEVVSQSETETRANGNSPIGTLAGKGTLVGTKGGKITYRAKEPGIIMAILSLTPRIDYSQGNKWHMTELNTMDDLHKPALDGIGFQDLMAEQMDSDAILFEPQEQDETYPNNTDAQAIGKLPAWQWYRTDINRTYGDFADKTKAMFMTLNRQYETDKEGYVTDATAYIDPVKYNYCFADAKLTAQNFWVQIKFDIKLRHVMSARNVLPYMR